MPEVNEQSPSLVKYNRRFHYLTQVESRRQLDDVFLVHDENFVQRNEISVA